MYCNTCFVSLRPGEGAVAISCGHLACRQCFERSIVPARRCGVCTKSTDDADMAWREIVIPSGINGPGDLLQLAGHDVDTCMSLSFAAIQFRCRQDDLYAKLRYDKLSQKLQATEAHYKKKIGIMNQGYEDLRVQVDALRREKREMEEDIRELRDKYGQKAKEAMSLRAASQGHGAYPARHHGNLLPSLPPMGPAHGPRSNSHNSPSTNLMPRSRSPHHTVRTLAYGSAHGAHGAQRYGSPYASTPARSSPSMLVSSMPSSGGRGGRGVPGGGRQTPPSRGHVGAGAGAGVGMGGRLVGLNPASR